jgi:hypothetical protein
MPIVDPGPFWKVDFAREHPKTEFSHGLDPKPPVTSGNSCHSGNAREVMAAVVSRLAAAGRSNAQAL